MAGPPTLSKLRKSQPAVSRDAQERLGAEQAGLLAAGHQQRRPACARSRRRRQLERQLRDHRHAGGVVVGAGDVLAAQLALGEQRPAGGEQDPSRARGVRRRRGRRRAAAPPPWTQAGRRLQRRARVQVGDERGWNISPLREVSRWQTRQRFASPRRRLDRRDRFWLGRRESSVRERRPDEAALGGQAGCRADGKRPERARRPATREQRRERARAAAMTANGAANVEIPVERLELGARPRSPSARGRARPPGARPRWSAGADLPRPRAGGPTGGAPPLAGPCRAGPRAGSIALAAAERGPR